MASEGGNTATPNKQEMTPQHSELLKAWKRKVPGLEKQIQSILSDKQSSAQPICRAHEDTIMEVQNVRKSIDDSVALTDATLHIIVARYVEGSSETLLQLSAGFIAWVTDDDENRKESMPLRFDEKVPEMIKLLAARKSYGIKARNAVLYEDSDVNALWCWEVENTSLLPVAMKSIVSKERQERSKISKKIKSIQRLLQLIERGTELAKINEEEEKLMKMIRSEEAARQKEEEKQKKETEKKQKDEQKRIEKEQKQQQKAAAAATDKKEQSKKQKKNKKSKAILPEDQSGSPTAATATDTGDDMEVESTAEPTPKAKKEKKEKTEKKEKKLKEEKKEPTTQSVEGDAMEEDRKEETAAAKKPAKTEKKTKEDASLNQQRSFFAKFLGIAPKPATVVPVATSPSKESDVVIVQDTTLEPAAVVSATGSVSPSVKVPKSKLAKKSDASDALLFQPYQIPCDTILRPAIRYATLSASVQQQIMAAVERTWRPTEHSDDNNDAMEVDVGSLQCWLPRWKKMKQNPKRARNRVRDADVEVIEQTDVQMESKRKDKKKYIKHHDSVSKPFYGPWVTISTVIRARKPLIRDLALVDYEAESEDEEEGEEVGDSGEEDEKDEEAPVEEEQDEEERWIVPDGYLSEDEVPEEEAEMQRKQNEILLNGEGDEQQQSGVMTVTDKKEGVPSSAAPGSSMARPIRQQNTLHRILIAPHESTSELDISLAKMLSAFEVVPFTQTPIMVVQTVKAPTGKSKGSKKNSPPRAGSNGELSVEGGSQPEQTQTVQKRTKKIDEPEYLKALVKMIHGSDSSLQKLITQYKENHELVSKKSVEEKIKEIASKSRREGTVKTCWYVNEPIFKSLDFSSDELESFRPVSSKVVPTSDMHTTVAMAVAGSIAASTDKQQAAHTFTFKTPSPKAKTKSSLMKKKSKALTAAIFATPHATTPSPAVCLSASSTVASIDSPLADVIVSISEHEPETPTPIAAYIKEKETEEETQKTTTTTATHAKREKGEGEEEGEGEGVESPVSVAATKTTAATKKVFAPVARVTLDAFFKRTPAKQDNTDNNKTSTNTLTAAVSKPVTISKTKTDKPEGMNKNNKKKDNKMKQSPTVVIDLDAPETVPISNVKSSSDGIVQKRKLNEEAKEKKKNTKKAKIDKSDEGEEENISNSKENGKEKKQKKRSKAAESVAPEPVAVKKRGPPTDRSKPPVSKKQKSKHISTEGEEEGKLHMAVETVVDDDDVVVISEETNEAATSANEPMQVESTAESSPPATVSNDSRDVQMTEAVEQESESSPVEPDSQTSESDEIVSELIAALSESVSDPQTVVAGCMDLLHSYFFIDCPKILPDPLLTALLSVISHADISSDLRSRSVRSISNYFGGVSMTISENPQVLKDGTMLNQIREIFTCLEDCVSAEQTVESTLLFKNIFRLLLSLSSLACLDDNVEHHVVFEQLKSELWLNRFMAALKDIDSQVRAYVTAVLDHMVGVSSTRMVLVGREKEKKDVMSSLLYAYSGQISAASASNLGPRKYTIKMLTSLLGCENFQTEQWEPLCAFIASCLRDEKQPVLQTLSVTCVEKMLDCHWISLSEESSSLLKSTLKDLVQTTHKEAVEAILTRRQ